MDVEDTAARFARLTKRWDNEAALHSSVSRMRAHPAYREIVAMGEEVVPLLVARLRERPSHLFMALGEITGANPIPDGHRGRIAPICEDWIAWFDERQANAVHSGP